MKPSPSKAVVETVPSSMASLTETTFYLIKLYTYNQEAVFGCLNEEQNFELNGIGQIAADEWQRSARAYASLKLDKWLLLPNRLEGIVSLGDAFSPNGYGAYSSKPRLLSSFVASYKAAAAKRINLLRNTPGCPLWQRGYQERFIPDSTVLKRVQQTLQQ
ncbi:MAG: hypothetical protein AAF609_11435 [Cyanobacteria bacterium P01_C01_bin.120]